MKYLKNLTRQQKIGILLLLLLLVSLPIALYLTRQQQEIRPRAALAGQADFILESSNNSPDKDETFTVKAKLKSTNNNVKVSGVDFRILYDKSKFYTAPTIAPEVGSNKPFTDVILTQVDQPYNDQFNYLRLVLVSRRLTPALSSGEMLMATITFKAKEDGDGIIRYPTADELTDINGVRLLQVVGIEPGSGDPTATPSPTP
ncbi:hypothetical protein HY407_02000 [Candidatus Gottesmanbacteria bacterium]|nr:hypothetical protein [Candidatus Gottesmanbacteria bacterium]